MQDLIATPCKFSELVLLYSETVAPAAPCGAVLKVTTADNSVTSYHCILPPMYIFRHCLFRALSQPSLGCKLLQSSLHKPKRVLAHKQKLSEKSVSKP